MKELNKYRRERMIAKLTGAHIRYNYEKVPWAIITRRILHQYRDVFQRLILGDKYSVISSITGLSQEHISMITRRHAPHLLRGKGNRRKDPTEPIEPTEKTWNTDTCKYELTK